MQALKGKFVKKISVGGYHTMVLTSLDEIYSWGSGTYGECGYGEVKNFKIKHMLSSLLILLHQKKLKYCLISINCYKFISFIYNLIVRKKTFMTNNQKFRI